MHISSILKALFTPKTKILESSRAAIAVLEQELVLATRVAEDLVNTCRELENKLLLIPETNVIARNFYSQQLDHFRRQQARCDLKLMTARGYLVLIKSKVAQLETA